MNTCAGCAEKWAACPILVEHQGKSNWRVAESGARPHVVALFRDPGIQAEREIETVLDLVVTDDGSVRNRQHCWTRAFAECMAELPTGFTVALDNGVRCPCPKDLGLVVYKERLKRCLVRTWVTLQEWGTDGRWPPIAVCDKDLALALSQLGVLTAKDGHSWAPNARFVESVGDLVRIHNQSAMILAHPIVVSRKRQAYEPAIRGAVDRLVAISNWQAKKAL